MLHPRTRLEEIRRLCGLTKAELSRRSEVPASTIQKIEDQQTKIIKAEYRESLAMALGIPTEQLTLPVTSPVIFLTGERAEAADTNQNQLQDTMAAMLTELRGLREDMRALKVGLGERDIQQRSDGAGHPEQTDGHDGDGRGSEQAGDGQGDGAGR